MPYVSSVGRGPAPVGVDPRTRLRPLVPYA